MKRRGTIVLAITDDRESCLKEIMGVLDRVQGREARSVAPFAAGSEPLKPAKSAFRLLNSMDIRVTGGRSAQQLQKQMNAGAVVIVLSSAQAANDLKEAGVFEQFLMPNSDLSDKNPLQQNPELGELSGAAAVHRLEEPGAPRTEEFAAKEVVLTTRELEILKFVADGRKNTEIAEALGISVRTVETHRASIMRKLNLHSIASLVRYAIHRNILAS